MRKNPLLTILLLSALSSAFAQKNTSQTKWLEKIYDSETRQVPRQEYLYHNKSKILYLLTNDRDHLYIDLIVPEQSSIRNIMEAGLKVWIDVTAKNKKHLGIQFPVAQEKPQRPSDQPDNNRPSNNDQRPETPPLDQRMQIELIGFGNSDSYFIDANEANHINGHLNFNEYRELTYHLKIPFDNLYGVSLVNQIISLNIVSNQTSNQGGGPPNGQSGGGMQGGGPPGGGGQGPPSGQGGMGMPQNQSSTSTINIKIKKLKIVDQG